MRSIVPVAAIVASSLVIGPALSANAAVNAWYAPISITEELTGRPLVATDGDVIASAFPGRDGGNTRARITISDDGGKTWTAPISISPAGRDIGFDGALDLVGDAGTLTAAWVVPDTTGVSVIQVSSSINGGTSWGTPITLSSPDSIDSVQPVLASRGGTITAVWIAFDTIANDRRVYSSSSLDRGVTWTEAATRSAFGYVDFPDVATDGNRITAVWRQDFSPQVSSSVDGGETWSAPVTVSTPAIPAASNRVVMSGGTTTLTWSSQGVQASSSADGGLTWSTPRPVSTYDASIVDHQLVAAGGVITSVWQEEVAGNTSSVKVASSTDGGLSWSSPVVLSGANAFAPQLVSDGRTITVAWNQSTLTDAGYTYAIDVATSLDDGASWSAPSTISRAGVLVSDPRLATDGVTVTVAWSSRPSGVEASSFSAPRRLAGSDRYETAVRIAQEFEPGVPVVYLATGTNYPDALSASSAAAFQDGPLLLTTPTALPQVVADELQRLNPSLVVIAGGEGVVSPAVQAGVEILLPSAEVRRDSGTDRYSTSRQLAREAFGGGSALAFVATGANFPDALSASAAAAVAGAPVVLINGQAPTIDDATIDLFTDLDTDRVVIVGGPSAVSAELQTALATLFGPANVTRLSGSDRYATSVAINSARFADAETVYLATGLGYADALAGAALAGGDGGPLYVVPGTCVPPAVINELDRLKAAKLVLFGGLAVLTNPVANLAPCP